MGGNLGKGCRMLDVREGQAAHLLWLCWSPILCAPAEGSLLELYRLILSCVLRNCLNGFGCDCFCLLWCLHRGANLLGQQQCESFPIATLACHQASASGGAGRHTSREGCSTFLFFPRFFLRCASTGPSLPARCHRSVGWCSCKAGSHPFADGQHAPSDNIEAPSAWDPGVSGAMASTMVHGSQL